MRSLTSNLIMRVKITTTKVRAKETARAVDKLITRAKLNTLASSRSLVSILPTEAVLKLIREVAPRFTTRQGGYTRVIKLGQRLKDGSEMAIVELVQMAPKALAAKGKKEIAKDKAKKAKVEKVKPAKEADKKQN